MHKTVLQTEAIKGLALTQNSVVIDCTLGVGGHANAILKHLGKNGVYVGIDADETALEAASKKVFADKPIKHFVHTNFKNLKKVVTELKLPPPNAILADLGWRSDQFETGNRGFSFNADEPLLMTYGNPKDYSFTAADIVNEWEGSSIADIIYGYGEERKARVIAKAIVKRRTESPIKTAKELADVVQSVMPKRGRIHPATKTFQALRMAVNDELRVLKIMLEDGFNLLAPEGRLVVITFHSLEDRVVKLFNKNKALEGKAKLINKRPITAGEEELKANPRSRSAKLRIIEKI